MKKPPFAADPSNIGVGHSGSGNVFADKEVQILEVHRPSVQPGGCDGLATVHVSCFDLGDPIPTQNGVQNAMVRLNVAWQSGIGGGEFQIDCTQGTMFTVGGTEVIEITARLVAVDGEPLVPWAVKRVEANVHWYGSTIGECMMSLPLVGLTVANGGVSAFQRIPLQSKSMIMLGDTPASFPAVFADFSTNDDPAGTGVKYTTLDPNANGTPIVHGVEFVRFRSAVVPQGVFGVFELYP